MKCTYFRLHKKEENKPDVIPPSYVSFATEDSKL
jgi:hypothetical protein